MATRYPGRVVRASTAAARQNQDDEELAAQAHEAAELLGEASTRAKKLAAEALRSTALSELTNAELEVAEQMAEQDEDCQRDAVIAAAAFDREVTREVHPEPWAEEMQAADESEYAILLERGEDETTQYLVAQRVGDAWRHDWTPLAALAALASTVPSLDAAWQSHQRVQQSSEPAEAALKAMDATAAARLKAIRAELRARGEVDKEPPKLMTNALGGATANVELFTGQLLAPVARALLGKPRSAMWAEAFAPILEGADTLELAADEGSASASIGQLSAALNALCSKALATLLNAHAVGSQYTKAQRAEARACFRALACGPWALTELLPFFEALHTKSRPSHLEVAWFHLWTAVCHEFAEMNAPDPPKIDETTKSPPIDSRDERRVAAYLAGWALFKVLKLAEKRACDQRFLPLLKRLRLELLSSLPTSDPARAYLQVRQQFGGLTIPTSPYITAFALARHVLTMRLEDEIFGPGLEKGIGKAYQRAVEGMRTDPSVRDAFLHALGASAATGLVSAASTIPATSAPPSASASSLSSTAEPAGAEDILGAIDGDDGAGPASDVSGAKAQEAIESSKANESLVDEALRTAPNATTDEERIMVLLLNRLTNSAGGEFRKQIISLTGLEREESSVAIRTRLKVEQVKTATGDAQPTKLAKGNLSLPSTVLHELLRIVASEAPEELTSNWATVLQLQAVLRAYVSGDSEIKPASLLQTSGVRKNDLKGALLATIDQSDGFVRFELIEKVRYK